jgi:hypothetical protein
LRPRRLRDGTDARFRGWSRDAEVTLRNQLRSPDHQITRSPDHQITRLRIAAVGGLRHHRRRDRRPDPQVAVPSGRWPAAVLHTCGSVCYLPHLRGEDRRPAGPRTWPRLCVVLGWSSSASVMTLTMRHHPGSPAGLPRLTPWLGHLAEVLLAGRPAGRRHARRGQGLHCRAQSMHPMGQRPFPPVAARPVVLTGRLVRPHLTPSGPGLGNGPSEQSHMRRGTGRQRPGRQHSLVGRPARHRWAGPGQAVDLCAGRPQQRLAGGGRAVSEEDTHVIVEVRSVRGS